MSFSLAPISQGSSSEIPSFGLERPPGNMSLIIRDLWKSCISPLLSDREYVSARSTNRAMRSLMPLSDRLEMNFGRRAVLTMNAFCFSAPQFTGLRQMRFSDCTNLDDQALQAIGQSLFNFPKLERFYLIGIRKVTIVGLRYLLAQAPKLTKLQTFKVRGCDHLGGVASVEIGNAFQGKSTTVHVDCTYEYRLTDVGIGKIAQAYSQCNVGSIALSKCCKLSPVGFALLTAQFNKWPNIRELDLSGTSVLNLENAPAFFTAMKSLRFLKSFDFSDCLQLGSDQFLRGLTSELGCFPELELVKCSPVRFSDEAMVQFVRGLSQNPQLKGNQFTRASWMTEALSGLIIEQLDKWPAFESLCFVDTQNFTDRLALQLVAQILKCKKLKVLKICSNQLTTEGALAIIQALPRCPTLDEFEIKGPKLSIPLIRDALLAHLAVCPFLKNTLNLREFQDEPKSKKKKTTL